MVRRLTRLAILDRGIAALRAVQAARELSRQWGAELVSVALHAEAEEGAMFVRAADEALALGEAARFGERAHGSLDDQALERILVASRADAVWVGWGSARAVPGLAELCRRLDIVFVGPDPAVLRLLGDKIAAKQLAERAGLPVARWSGGSVGSVSEAMVHAEHVGYPIMVKAAAGSGGRALRPVERAAELPGAFAAVRAEAFRTLGDGTVLLEKLIAPARHVEVQVIVDEEGGAWPLGVRDCSYQRGHQKIVAESSSPALTSTQTGELMDAARQFVLQAGCRNAATVEFLYDPSARRFWFLEINPRLGLEHPATEAVTGLDLVKLQLEVAAGRRLTGPPPACIGHAVAVRLRAEDPERHFAPAPGRVAALRLPNGPGVRVDPGVAEGDLVRAEIDPAIATLVGWGGDRDEAVARLARALSDTVVVLDGGTTDQGFLLELINRPEVLNGAADTAWLDGVDLGRAGFLDRHGDIALLQAAIELADRDLADDRARFYALARRGRPEAAPERERAYELRHRGHAYAASVAQTAPDRYRVAIDDVTLDVAVRRHGEYERRLVAGCGSYRTQVAGRAHDLLVQVDGIPHRVARDDGGVVVVPSPSVVVSIPVQAGDEVQEGDVVAVVEAMKMESALLAPFRGRVRDVLCGENVYVTAGTPLVVIDPLDARDAPIAAGNRLAFVAEPTPCSSGERRLDELRRTEWLVLGYDVDDALSESARAAIRAARAEPHAGDPALIAAEHRLLHLYADIRALSRPQLREDDPDVAIESPREELHAWLGSLDAASEGLSEAFLHALRRALAHYGIAGLERTPALEEAAYRLFLAQHRSERARATIVAILEERLARAGELAQPLEDPAGPEPGRLVAGSADADDLLEALDRIVAVFDGRDQVVADLAREVRYRYFDQPVMAEARERVYAEMARQIAALATATNAVEIEAAIDAIVQCRRPLATLLTTSMRPVASRVRALLVEAMVRRYYRVRMLEGFEPLELPDATFLLGRYEFAGRTRHLAASYIELSQVRTAASAFARFAQTLPEGDLAVLDLYAEHRTEGDGAAPLAERLAEALADVPGPPALQRIVVAVAEPRRGRGMGAVDLHTFRPARDGQGGLVEDVVLRGLHPMMYHRLELWRLSEFELERLPSPEDIYLFRGTARASRDDQRLFASAELRDLTPVLDGEGHVVALPELERVLVSVFETIRAVQAPRPLHRRVMWNRVLLKVWPVIDLDLDELRALMARLTPLAAGLGLEMVILQGRVREADGRLRERMLRFIDPTGHEVALEVNEPPAHPLRPRDEGARRMISARRRGMLHPAEVVRLMAPEQATADHPAGEFTELDLNASGRLVTVERPPATNSSGIVVGTVRNFTERYPEGMMRVVLLGDPTRALGSLAEPECQRIIAAVDLAEELDVPVEWIALSAGAKIAMDSGTEMMDWIARVLRRIVLFTQAGGEVNVIVAGINVGAQPYFNAEATMLLETRGALIMIPESAMVLTGKQSLDYSGGVSAEDNFGIGGYDRIMGPNGEAQYWAPDLASACRLLLAHYEHTYVAPGERFPRRARTADPAERDISADPLHTPGSPLRRVGDIFSATLNPERKQPFDIRSVMRAVTDRDHPSLERWGRMHGAETAAVWEAHLGGWPVTLIGIESRPLPRHGAIPADGPQQWTSGTLFPRSAKKIARAINAAGGRRPLVVLANLAGFDGSPESMRDWQLEFGAEIGRAVVNYDGPIVFCVVSRYHGGSFVVFSHTLNPNMETVALEGARASVIGGGPAAAVVFAREVERTAAADPRIVALDERIAAADPIERQRLRSERAVIYNEVLAEHRRHFADRFDATHSVERAVRMGSVDTVVAPGILRRHLVEAVERGIERTLAAAAADNGSPVVPGAGGLTGVTP